MKLRLARKWQITIGAGESKTTTIGPFSSPTPQPLQLRKIGVPYYGSHTELWYLTVGKTTVAIK